MKPVEFVSHTHSDVGYPFTQYDGQAFPALGSLVDKHAQSVVDWLTKLYLHAFSFWHCATV